MKRFITLIGMVMTVTLAMGAKTVEAHEFGVEPNSYTNYVEQIATAIKYCRDNPGTTLRFQPGRYDIWADGAVKKELYISNTSSETECPSKVKTIGIYLDSLENITIDGQGATFIMHGDITPVAAIHCKNLMLRNFTIDFERPGGSELTYTRTEPGVTELKVNPATRYDIRDGRINIIGEGWRSNIIYCVKLSPANGHYTYSNDWHTLSESPVCEIAPGLLRFYTPEDFKPENGATLTLRDIIRRQVGMLLLESQNVKLEDLKVRYMHGLGIVGQYSRNITLKRLDCCPSEESGRVMASSADFTHFSGCSGLIDIEDCKFIGAQDDAVNVHGTNLRVTEIVDRHTAIVRFMHHQSYGYDAFWSGDTVAFVNPSTMLREAYTTVSDVQRIDPRHVRLTFSTPLPAGVKIDETCVENITCTPSLLVKGCHIARLLTRGILCTTPRPVIIENNIFDRTANSAILIESDAKEWYESGPVNNITIHNNTFIDCGYTGNEVKSATIALNPSNTIIDPDRPVHRNITITGNNFNTFGRSVLYAKSTSDILFSGNTVAGDNPTFIFLGCNNVDIADNNKMDRPNVIVKPIQE